jgi:hypothetical protein
VLKLGKPVIPRVSWWKLDVFQRHHQWFLMPTFWKDYWISIFKRTWYMTV